MYKQL